MDGRTVFARLVSRMFFGSILIIRVSTVAIIFLFLLSPLSLLAVGVLLRHFATMAEHIRYDIEDLVPSTILLSINIYYYTRNWVSTFRICYYKPSATALKIRFERG